MKKMNVFNQKNQETMNTDAEPKLIYQTTAIERLGISKTQFLKLELPIAKTVKNPHIKRRKSYLYEEDAIDALVGSEQILTLQAEKRKARRQKDYAPIFAKRYSEWQEAIPLACEYMFNLNRYAQYSICRSKEQIYDLKNQFIQVLYQRTAYTTSTALHYLAYPAKICYECEGRGQSFPDEPCYYCAGSGEYLPPSRLDFVSFIFKVEEQTYSWYQPLKCVNFTVKYTEESRPMGELKKEQITMDRSKFPEGKALIRWVIKEAKIEENE